MTGLWIQWILAAGCLLIGLIFMITAVFGVNRFKKALNRMHAAALGDTLGILFVILGLILIRGFSVDSLKLFLVILFFWIASPVSGHMLSRLEVMTSIVIFMSYSLEMCVIWVLLQSPDLAITEAAVGAGVTSILFFVTLKKIRAIRKEKTDEPEEG